MIPADPGADPLIVGIDIGGTKTHLRAEPQHGGGHRDLIVPSSSWRTRDWNGDAAALLKLVDQLVAGAPVTAIGIGAHGCDDAEECKALENAVAARTTASVAVVNDAELMPLALGYPGQIGVVAGTGSIAVCRPQPDRMMVAGGWGWIIGDEGSAAALVRQAVRAVALHFDRGGDASEPLSAAMLASLEVKAIPRLGSTLGELRSAAEVGVHAVAVFDAAKRGSKLADEVVRDGGRMLAELAGLLEARGAGAEHVVAGGSVIVEQPSLWEAFVAGLAATSPHLTPHLFIGTPVEGACALARSNATA
jgi:N-acetylglucosamine kinase-like BadF-type ATPase